MMLPLRVRKSQGCPLGRDMKIYFWNDVAFAGMEGEDLEKRRTYLEDNVAVAGEKESLGIQVQEI